MILFVESGNQIEGFRAHPRIEQGWRPVREAIEEAMDFTAHLVPVSGHAMLHGPLQGR